MHFVCIFTLIKKIMEKAFERRKLDMPY